MNILLTKFPEKVEVNGKYYSIESDFRAWIKFENNFIHADTDKKKIELIFSMFKEFPSITELEDFKSAVTAIINFYSCGENSNKESGARSEVKPIYSFDKDQFHIYTDFLQFYKIDLNDTGYMHWWKFKQLFLELPEKSKIKTIMMYRTIKITSKMSPEYRQFYAKMKKLYSLEDTKSVQDKVKSAGSVLAGYMKK